jgi:hypothetical protein
MSEAADIMSLSSLIRGTLHTRGTACSGEMQMRFTSRDFHYAVIGEGTLSRQLHTAPLPAPHLSVGYR